MKHMFYYKYKNCEIFRNSVEDTPDFESKLWENNNTFYPTWNSKENSGRTLANF